MIKLAIVGSRNFNNIEYFDKIINGWIDNYGKPDIIISGGANGVDNLAKIYAKKNNILFKEFLADWKQYGKSAGPRRNAQIVGESTHIIAFPSKNGRGTQDTIRKGKYLKKIMEIHYID